MTQTNMETKERREEKKKRKTRRKEKKEEWGVETTLNLLMKHASP